MIQVVCDGHCPLFGKGECELDLFPGSRPPTRCPRYTRNKTVPETRNPLHNL